MAMRKLGSRYAAERLMAILALGFLKDASAQAALQSCLLQASSQTAVHAARALLEIDASRHANQVASALLARSDLDLSLVSAMLKPFRQRLRQALLTQLREDPSLNDSAWVTHSTRTGRSGPRWPRRWGASEGSVMPMCWCA